MYAARVYIDRRPFLEGDHVWVADYGSQKLHLFKVHGTVDPENVATAQFSSPEALESVVKATNWCELGALVMCPDVGCDTAHAEVWDVRYEDVVYSVSDAYRDMA